MTIQSTVRKAGPFLGNGVTIVFPFTFKCFNTSDLQVVKTSTAGVDGNPLVLNSDYSVALNADQNASPGGSITYPLSGTLLQTGEKLTATGVLAELQGTHITNGGNFFANNIEDQMDYLTILVQQHAEKLARVLLASSTDAAPTLLLGTAAQRALKYLTFDASGNASLAQSLPSGTLSQSTILTFLAGSSTSLGSILYPQTSVETTAGAVIVSTIYGPGDPRRATFYTNTGWVDFGDLPTYVDATHITVPGDQTGRYVPFTRVMVVGAASRADTRVVSSSFAASKTTLTLSMAEIGGVVPIVPIAAWVQTMPSTTGPNCLINNSNTIVGTMIINRGQGATAASRIALFTTDAAGASNAAVALLAVNPTYSGPYIAGGYGSGGRAVLYTPPSYTLEIGTSDTARILIPADNTKISFINDIQNDNPNASRATIAANGLSDAMFQVKVANAQVAYFLASTTETMIGSSGATDFSLIYNGARAFTINGVSATGTATPSAFTNNKPGSNAGAISWIPVKTSGGTQGYIPIFG